MFFHCDFKHYQGITCYVVVNFPADSQGQPATFEFMPCKIDYTLIKQDCLQKNHYNCEGL